VKVLLLPGMGHSLEANVYFPLGNTTFTPVEYIPPSGKWI